jgi:hypothetical protein
MATLPEQGCGGGDGGTHWVHAWQVTFLHDLVVSFLELNLHTFLPGVQEGAGG